MSRGSLILLAAALAPLLLSGCAHALRAAAKPAVSLDAGAGLPGASWHAGGSTTKSATPLRLRPDDGVASAVRLATRGRGAAAARPGRSGSAGDPVGEAFTQHREGIENPRTRLSPSTGTFGLGRVRSGTLYGRGWERDRAFRGLGLGLLLPTRGSLRIGAEIGVDPSAGPAGGGLVLVTGLSLTL